MGRRLPLVGACLLLHAWLAASYLRHESRRTQATALKPVVEQPIRVVWNVSVGARVLARPALTRDNSSLFVAAANQLFRLRAKDGSQEWQTDATYGDNLLSVALLSDDTVVATTDGAVTEQGAVVAVDAEDGGVLWRYDAKGIIARGGASFSPDGDRIYVGTYWGQLHAINSTTGQRIWAFGTNLTQHYASPPIVSHDGSKLFVMSDNRSTVWAIDANSGNSMWKSPDPLSSSSLSSEEEQPSLAMSADGALLFASGQAGVRAIRTDTGAQVWQQPMAGMGQRPALVPWGQERLVAVTSGGDVRVLEAGTGRVQHTWDVGKQLNATLVESYDVAAIDRGRLLVGDRVRLERLGLHVIDLDQGRVGRVTGLRRAYGRSLEVQVQTPVLTTEADGREFMYLGLAIGNAGRHDQTGAVVKAAADGLLPA